MKVIFNVLGISWIIVGIVIAFNMNIMIPLAAGLLPVNWQHTPLIVSFAGTLFIYFVFPGLILIGIASLIKQEK